MINDCKANSVDLEPEAPAPGVTITPEENARTAGLTSSVKAQVLATSAEIVLASYSEEELRDKNALLAGIKKLHDHLITWVK